MLESNRRRVQNLTAGEIWLFIIARVLIGFAGGIFAALYFPAIAAYLVWPILVLGVLAMIIPAKGLLRKLPPGPTA